MTAEAHEAPRLSQDMKTIAEWMAGRRPVEERAGEGAAARLEEAAREALGRDYENLVKMIMAIIGETATRITESNQALLNGFVEKLGEMLASQLGERLVELRSQVKKLADALDKGQKDVAEAVKNTSTRIDLVEEKLARMEESISEYAKSMLDMLGGLERRLGEAIHGISSVRSVVEDSVGRGAEEVKKSILSVSSMCQHYDRCVSELQVKLGNLERAVEQLRFQRELQEAFRQLGEGVKALGEGLKMLKMLDATVEELRRERDRLRKELSAAEQRLKRAEEELENTKKRIEAYEKYLGAVAKAVAEEARGVKENWSGCLRFMRSSHLLDKLSEAARLGYVSKPEDVLSIAAEIAKNCGSLRSEASNIEYEYRRSCSRFGTAIARFCEKLEWILGRLGGGEPL